MDRKSRDRACRVEHARSQNKSSLFPMRIPEPGHIHTGPSDANIPEGLPLLVCQ
jgi:hypothetical protein